MTSDCYLIDDIPHHIVWFKYSIQNTLGFFLVPSDCCSVYDSRTIQISSNFASCTLKDPNNVWISKPHLWDKTVREKVEKDVYKWTYLNGPSLLERVITLGIVKRLNGDTKTSVIIGMECEIILPHPPVEDLPHQNNALPIYFSRKK